MRVCLQPLDSWPVITAHSETFWGSGFWLRLMGSVVLDANENDLGFVLVKNILWGGKASATARQWCQHFICTTILTPNSITSSSTSPDPPPLASAPLQPPTLHLPSSHSLPSHSFHPFFYSTSYYSIPSNFSFFTSSFPFHPLPFIYLFLLCFLFLFIFFSVFFLSDLCPPSPPPLSASLFISSSSSLFSFSSCHFLHPLFLTLISVTSLSYLLLSNLPPPLSVLCNVRWNIKWQQPRKLASCSKTAKNFKKDKQTDRQVQTPRLSLWQLIKRRKWVRLLCFCP